MLISYDFVIKQFQGHSLHCLKVPQNIVHSNIKTYTSFKHSPPQKKTKNKTKQKQKQKQKQNKTKNKTKQNKKQTNKNKSDDYDTSNILQHI